MPLLASLLSSLLGSAAGVFVGETAKKVATAAAAVVAFALSLGVLMAMFNGLVAPLVQAMFTTSYGQFIGLAFPPIAGTCMASITTCWIGCALYKLKVQSIKMSASA